MFTGLVETVGTLLDTAPRGGGMRARIAAPFARELGPGESVAVNGVCLTTIGHSDAAFDVDIGPETMAVTSLAGLAPGSLVNLERAMRADQRFGGHFVQGHVDAVGRVESLRADAEFHRLTVSFPGIFARNLIPKGSIAVDGISLTVAQLGNSAFEVMLIPFTMAHTNLKTARVGTIVNLEFDMLGKYVARAAELAVQNSGPPPESPSD